MIRGQRSGTSKAPAPVTGRAPSPFRRTRFPKPLPKFPTAVSAEQLQRVLDEMVQFGLLPQSDGSFKMSAMTG